ncbi:DUF945 domain-containing protein [Marinobacter maroccanus]|uniref:DUF945 domain-containing protein n=1 Tax=Marinobacter maroccanus TaxID=2055143 RepID=A0A2S5ZBM4_9GAMM|nr:DUF945 family protein [Marinobacter maroccanus]PPI84787.1 DUF945 domain-containing protein [Marinobacter maroccanus]
MNAKWMIAGAGVLAVAGGLPWVVGYVTEQQWQQATAEVNSAQPFLRMETENYQRGILGARLNGSVNLRNPETGESRQFAYRATVTHGVTGSLMDFEPEGGWSSGDLDWSSGEEPRLTLETRLWGTAVLELEAPEVSITDADTGESLASSGGLARIEISDAGSQADALMVWPALTLSGPDVDIRVSDFRLEQTMSHLTGEVWTGSGEIVVDSVAVTPVADAPFTLQEISVRSSSEPVNDGERLDSRMAFEVAGVATANERYGPQRLVFALSGLDVAAWSGLTESLSSLQALALSQASGGPQQVEQQMAAMQQVNTALRDLAAAGFSVGFPELTVTTPEGVVEGSASISHPELTADQKGEMLMVMQRLTGEMDLSLPLALAEEYPEFQLQLAPLIKQGLLVQQGDRLVLDASMKDLMLDVNGVEIPLPPLL